MPFTRLPYVVALALTAGACTEDELVPADAPDAPERVARLALPPPPQRLRPPAPYVLAADGETRLDLERAGILAPGGTAWALALGKALFWDQQAGSDGEACASCHFAAGADLRIRNQLSPGFEDTLAGPGGDPTFGSRRSDTGELASDQMPSGRTAGPNYTLVPADFPLHVLVDERDRNSALRTTTNDVVSSQGTPERTFVRVGRHGGPDRCGANGDVFQVHGRSVRQVEPRNTPTTINAAFFFANFWDGRANETFNGVGVFGPRDVAGDPDLRLAVWEHGRLGLGVVEVHNASLASQAVGPPISEREMSCLGRTLPDVGRKLIGSHPLDQQWVARTDSILGPLANHHGKGLRPGVHYATLIARAFAPKYWAAPGRFRIRHGHLVPDHAGYTQMELNFSMFWGISIMLYEQTLISDQSRFDDWFESCRPQVSNPEGPGSLSVPIANPVVTCRPAADNPNQSTDPRDHGFTAEEALGFGLFAGGGVGIRNPGSPACTGCHPVTNANATPLVSPVFSEAAFQDGEDFLPVERTRVDDPGAPRPFEIAGATHQRGFFNLGLRAATTDLGNGGFDPYGNPLSIARMFLDEQAGLAVPDPSGIADRCNTPRLVEPGGTPPYPGCPSAAPPPLDLATERHLVDGSFKTPSIRNVGLTPPYFHYGGYRDLRTVVEVYARGGNKRDLGREIAGATGDWSGTGPVGDGAVPGVDHGTNVDFFIRDIRSTDEQIDALVAFMLTTTDPRVQCDRAPFDHPELTITNGHAASCTRDGDALEDLTFALPAVGAAGYTGSRARYCIPNAGDLFAPGMAARRGGD